jgi:hypothetical protein
MPESQLCGRQKPGGLRFKASPVLKKLRPPISTNKLHMVVMCKNEDHRLGKKCEILSEK